MKNKKQESKVYIYGNHSIKAAIQNKSREIYEIYAAKNKMEEVSEWLGKQYRDIKLYEVDENFLDEKLRGQTHQNVLAVGRALPECKPDDVKGNVLLMDQVQDIRNIGAIMRSCASFNFHNMFFLNKNMPDVYSPALYGQIAKTASGALEKVRFGSVANLSNVIEKLKKEGYWVAGLDEKGENLNDYHKKYSFEKMALVIGQEGKGLRSLTKQSCDLIFTIPTTNFTCLNASVAASIGMYEINKK